jgi:hypothetical protein
MVFEEGIEILDGFLQVAALVEDRLGHPDETALLIGNNSSSAGYIINERYFPERITRVVVYALLLPLIFLVLSLHIVDAFQHDVKILSSLALPKHHFANLMLLQFQAHGQLGEMGRLEVEALLDEDDLLRGGRGTLMMLMSSSRS